MQGRDVPAHRFCGVTGKDDDEVFENFIKAVADMKAKVGIKRTFRDYGVKEEDFLATLDEMVVECLQRLVHRRKSEISVV